MDHEAFVALAAVPVSVTNYPDSVPPLFSLHPCANWFGLIHPFAIMQTYAFECNGFTKLLPLEIWNHVFAMMLDENTTAKDFAAVRQSCKFFLWLLTMQYTIPPNGRVNVERWRKIWCHLNGNTYKNIIYEQQHNEEDGIYMLKKLFCGRNNDFDPRELELSRELYQNDPISQMLYSTDDYLVTIDFTQTFFCAKFYCYLGYSIQVAHQSGYTRYTCKIKDREYDWIDDDQFPVYYSGCDYNDLLQVLAWKGGKDFDLDWQWITCCNGVPLMKIFTHQLMDCFPYLFANGTNDTV